MPPAKVRLLPQSHLPDLHRPGLNAHLHDKSLHVRRRIARVWNESTRITLASASSVAEACRRQEEAGEEARGQEARGEEDHRQEAGGGQEEVPGQEEARGGQEARGQEARGQEEVPGQEEVRGQEEVDVTSLGILCMGMGHFQSTLACASSADVQC